MIGFMNKKPVIFQAFEWNISSDGSYWKWLGEHAALIKEMGFTAVWIPPAYKGTGGFRNNCTKDEGYGVYDLWDLGEFNQCGSVRTKYGTKEELKKSICELKKQGLMIYADIVLNHKIGIDEDFEWVNVVDVDPSDRNKIISKPYQIPATTKYNFEARNNKYSNFKWNYEHFTGTDYDIRDKENFKVRLFENKTWAQDVDQGYGNFDYLMGADIDHTHPEVQQDLMAWGKWYTDLLQLDGYRLDVVKHISFQFMHDWLHEMRTHTDRNLFSVGEYPTKDVNELLNYLEKTPNTHLFDFPLQFKFHEASTNRGFDLRLLFKGTLTNEKALNSVTFVNNHDTQPGQSMNHFVDDRFRKQAYAMILLQEHGVPCVFHGDVLGVRESDELDHVKHKGIHKEIIKLIKLRNKYAFGKEHQYEHCEHIIGFTREGIDYKSGCAVLLSAQKISGSVKMFVGMHHAGQQFISAFGSKKELVDIDENGYGIFILQQQSLNVFTPVL